ATTPNSPISGRGGTRTLTAQRASRLANARDKPIVASLPNQWAVGSGRWAVNSKQNYSLLSYCRLPTAHRRLIHASARTRTRNTAFEAPHDCPFHHGGSLHPSPLFSLPSPTDFPGWTRTS